MYRFRENQPSRFHSHSTLHSLMKKFLLILISALFVTAASVSAKSKAQTDWAENAAVKYEKKAAIAKQNGEVEAAKIYKRMAQIKRDAGKASKQGKKYDWSEYHKLEGKLNQLKHKKVKTDKQPEKKKY